MTQPPITNRQAFEVTYSSVGAQKIQFRDLLLSLISFFRANVADAYSDWHQDTDYSPTPIPIFQFPWFDRWNYRSNGWRVIIDLATNPAANFAALTPDQVFGETELAELYLKSSDTAYFEALSMILRDLVSNWVEQPARVGTVNIHQVDSGHWGLTIHLAGDSGSRWPSAFQLDVVGSWLSGIQGTFSDLSYSTETYVADFLDSAGEVAHVSFHAFSTLDARQIANSIAAQSDGKWVDLWRHRTLVVPTEDANGDPIFTNFSQAAGEGSDVQRKGRGVYNVANPDDRITVEIPSVKGVYLSRSNLKTSTDPLSTDLRAMLLTENNAPAMVLKRFHFVPNDRRR